MGLLKAPLIQIGLLMRATIILAIGLLTFIAATASAGERFVSLSSPDARPPYTDWTTAATNIQDAIEVAAPGDLIWVTNGVYGNGGKTISGDLTNRIAITKAVTVRSVNGAAVTLIKGA